MRLVHSWFGNDGQPDMTANGPRYQVRWRVIGDGARRETERKRTDFVTKAKAREFMEELDKAHHGAVDHQGRIWHFDAQGHPTNLRDVDTTVMGGSTSTCAIDGSPSGRPPNARRFAGACSWWPLNSPP